MVQMIFLCGVVFFVRGSEKDTFVDKASTAPTTYSIKVPRRQLSLSDKTTGGKSLFIAGFRSASIQQDNLKNEPSAVKDKEKKEQENVQKIVNFDDATIESPESDRESNKEDDDIFPLELE